MRMLQVFCDFRCFPPPRVAVSCKTLTLSVSKITLKWRTRIFPRKSSRHKFKFWRQNFKKPAKRAEPRRWARLWQWRWRRRPRCRSPAPGGTGRCWGSAAGGSGAPGTGLGSRLCLYSRSWHQPAPGRTQTQPAISPIQIQGNINNGAQNTSFAVNQEGVKASLLIEQMAAK